MKFFDLTLPLSSATVPWPGDTKFQREERRGSAIVSRITLSAHSGTHIDAPKHFLFSKSGIDRILPEKLIGPAKVFVVKSKGMVTVADLKKFDIKKGDKILLKTRNSSLLKKKNFSASYVSVSLEAAGYLALKKIDLIAIDYFGVEAKSAPGHPVHKTLLAAGIVIVEAVDLSAVKPGKYSLAALPLKIKSGDGSPARVVLWK